MGPPQPPGTGRRAKLEPDFPGADVAGKIFQMAGGLDDGAIACSLIEQGVSGSAGKEWTRERIRRIRGNEGYAGTSTWGRTSEDGSLPVVVESTVPAIVSCEVFDREIPQRGASPS